MVTIEEVQKEIDELAQIVVNKRSINKFNKCTKEIGRMNFLTYLKFFLETGTSDEYLHREADRLEKKLKAIERNFNDWKPLAASRGVNPAKFRSVYNSEVGLTYVKRQLKAITYLINGK